MESMMPRIAKWVLGLQGFNFKMVYVPGSMNNVADYLSRAPVECGEDSPLPKETILEIELPAVAQDQWESQMKQDRDLEEVKKLVINGWPSKCKDLPEGLQCFWNVRDDLSIEGSLLLKSGKIIPPEGLRDHIIDLTHEGHLGRSLSKARLRAEYWFPKMDQLMEEKVRDCVACSRSDKSKCLRRSPLIPVEVPMVPWNKLGLNIAGPIQAMGPQEWYILVLVGYFSNWITHKFVNKINTKSLTNFLC